MAHLDLHRHLEGSHSVKALLAVAHQFDMRDKPMFFNTAEDRFRTEAELAADISMDASGDPDKAGDKFVSCIAAARAAYTSVPAIGALARAAFREAAAECSGFEMRISLFSMTRVLARDAWESRKENVADEFARPILVEIIAARDEVQRETQVPILLRLGLTRGYRDAELDRYRAIMAMVPDHASSLVGLDVLGILGGDDPEPLSGPLVEMLAALRPRLPDLTIHAGEFDGHASIERTLALSPRGIGHGVHALESPAILERLTREGVTLEVCPTSNRVLIAKRLAALEQLHGGKTPLLALQQAGVYTLLGSDDPTVLRTTFPEELAIARAAGVDMDLLEQHMTRRWNEITA